MISMIRNFCIIAHIDHGKSTLADRFLEITGTVQSRRMRAQYLDTMDIERERGITIKLQPVRMNYQNYQLNLIDTPGHVDFSYEVSRSLAAVEGAILLVDASQGIEAQTLANLYQALEHNLTIIPVVNKIDLPHAEPDKVASELASLLGVDKETILLASGKTGEGVEKILQTVITQVPPPTQWTDQHFRALIFDSVYDSYRGVIAYIRVKSGCLKNGQHLVMKQVGSSTISEEVGFFSPDLSPCPDLSTGEIGYVVTGFKDVSQARVGDTINLSDQITEALPGYHRPKSLVYAGLYCLSGDDYPLLKEALAKLRLSDAALEFEPESSNAFGFGFRCGFLGLLHLEIVKERLEREFNLQLIITSPSVSYQLKLKNGQESFIHSPSELPDSSTIEEIREPWLICEIVLPKSNIGSIMEMTQLHRGKYLDLHYLDEDRAILKYELPVSEMIVDFYDRLKGLTSGYGSMSYELIGYRPADLVLVKILIAGQEIDSLSSIIFQPKAVEKGRALLLKLKQLIPRQLFEITLQATIGGKIVAREDIPAVGKDVTAKLYGGDVTRKRKLLEKQKEGKQRLKRFGKVDVPTEVFLHLLKD